MSSPGDKKGRRWASCGHIMASFDNHDKCARCSEKRIREDNCVLDKPCSICDSFTESQKEMLLTPMYRIRKEKKTGLLVSPADVTVIASVEDRKPAFQSPPHSSVQASAHAQPEASASSFVTSDQLKEIFDQWAEQFARFEELLSRGNVFSTPKTNGSGKTKTKPKPTKPVKPIPSHTVVSDTAFIAPSVWLTGPVESLAEVEADQKHHKSSEPKEKKKSRKSRKEGKDKDNKKRADSPSSDRQTTSRQDCIQPPVSAKPPVPAQATFGPESVQQARPKSVQVQTSSSDQQEIFQPSSTSQDLPMTQPSTSGFTDSSLTGAYNYPPEPEGLDIDQQQSDSEYSDDQADSDEGEISSDTLDKPEQTEDMNYQETVRSIHSFMGWNHIPTFESDLSEPDKSNNLWKLKTQTPRAYFSSNAS